MTPRLPTRRKVITLLGGALGAAGSVRAWGQRANRVRWIGMLVLPRDDATTREYIRAFEGRLKELGWAVGDNLAIEYRWEVNDANAARSAVEQIMRISPEVILTNGGPALMAAQQTTRTLPIVFWGVSEPVERGFVASLAHPGGNTTGFTNLEATVGGKWLALLREIAPRITRVGLMFSPTSSFAQRFYVSTQVAAETVGTRIETLHVDDAKDISKSLIALGSQHDAGLLLPPDGFTAAHRRQLVDLSTTHELPALAANKAFPREGGLMSYGIDQLDPYLRAANYVDRILRGEKPADLPVETPTKYELVINLRTARALGLTVPPTLLARADDVIE